MKENQNKYNNNFDLSDEIYKKIQIFLNRREEIKYIYDYNPSLPLKRNLIMIIVGISIMVIIYLLLTTSLYIYFINLFFVLFFISSICVVCPCLFQLTYLITMKRNRGKLFVITNRQIISVISGTFRTIKYVNISLINRRDILKKLYLIELILKKPVIDDPDFLPSEFVIPVIPYDNELIFNLKNLIEEESKRQIKINYKRDTSIIDKNYS